MKKRLGKNAVIPAKAGMTIGGAGMTMGEAVLPIFC